MLHREWLPSDAYKYTKSIKIIQITPSKGANKIQKNKQFHRKSLVTDWRKPQNFIKNDAKTSNSDIKIKNIPLEAYDYQVNGKSAIEWIIERYTVNVNKDSGIENNPNLWCEENKNPRYILDLLLSIISLSLKTNELIKELPKIEF